VENSQKFEDETLSEKISAEMEFCKIDPWMEPLSDLVVELALPDLKQ
jgi:hypothetical protein